jgi:dihydrofolate reductase
MTSTWNSSPQRELATNPLSGKLGADHHGLIDEFHFTVFPLTVGRGLRLFEGIEISGLALKLTGTKTFANGIVQLSYVPR